MEKINFLKESSRIGVPDFLLEQPLMALRPSVEFELRLKGTFRLDAFNQKEGHIVDTYRLTIEIPQNFPREIPKIYEINNKIPRTPDYHVNSDGSLCLGQPVRLISILYKQQTLSGFIEKCLIPYLYATNVKLSKGGKMLFDELDHGKEGILTDCKNIFALSNNDQALKVIRLLSLKKRIANKYACPCLCGRILAKYKLNRKISTFRSYSSRSWYRKILEQCQ